MVKINDIEIGANIKELISTLKEKNKKIARGFNNISYEDKINGIDCTILVLFKSKIIYQVTITGFCNSIPLKLDYDFIHEGNTYYYKNDDMLIEYSIINNNYFYIRYSLTGLEVSNKAVNAMLFGASISIAGIFYLVSYLKIGFNLLILSIFIAGALGLGILMIYIYRLIETSGQNKYDCLDKEAIDGYLFRYKCLTSYGNSNYNLKANPMYFYVFSDYFLITILIKGNKIKYKYLYEDILDLDYNSDIKLRLNDRDLSFFIDEEDERLAFVNFIKEKTSCGQ